MTNYTYKTYTKNNDSMASSQVDSVENKVYYGTVLSDDNVNNSYNFTYDYDDNNNITYEYAVEQDGTRTVRYHYVYDEADQLIRFDDHVNKDDSNFYHSYVYTYNAGGNRISTKIYNYTLGELVGEPTTISQTYGMNLNNNSMLWNDRLKTFNDKVITYDLEGNPTSYDGKTYKWNGKQLTQITAADGTYTQYNYDINGLRTQKRQYDSDNTLLYIVDYVWSDGKIITQSLSVPITITIHGNTNTQWIKIDSKFIYADGEDSPSAIMLNNDEYLLVRNLQGDVTAVVNGSTGETIVEFSYDAWGKISYKFCDEWTEGKTEEEISQMEMLITALCPVTYRGYNYDFTTGLYYLQSRYYNAEWGRFLNTDDTSILLATTGTTLGANMFAYCNNNPINRVDYSGYKSSEEKQNEKLQALALSALILINSGYDYYFNDSKTYGQFVDFGSKKDEYGLIHCRFAFKKSTNKYNLMEFIIGATAEWFGFASNQKVLSPDSQYAINQAWNGVGGISLDLNFHSSKDVEGTLAEIPNHVHNAIVGMASNYYELSDAYQNRIYIYPYLGIIKKYQGCEGIGMLYKMNNHGYVYKTNYINCFGKLSVPSVEEIVAVLGG